MVSGELFATAYNFLTFSLSHLFSFFRNFACANQRERMIVGYDAKRIVRNGTGLGSYSRTLVNNLAETGADSLELRLYAPDAGRDDLRCQIAQRPNIKWCYPKLKPQTSKLKALYWRSWGIVKDLVRDGVQVYHGLSGRTVREADHIIAISECTKRDIMELGHVPEEKITVIYQSYAPRFGQLLCPPRGTKGGLYILSVGTIEERKNALLAVQALHYLPENLSLVLVGRATDYARKVRQYADSHGLGERVVMLHNVTNEQLPQLYADAEAFVYPSRYEGFGIPIIEAIAMGLPVVAATGSCLEEAGGPHSLYVGPDDAEALAAAVRQVLRGAPGREERIAASRDYIRRFEGQDVARQVIDIYSLPLSQGVEV